MVMGNGYEDMELRVMGKVLDIGIEMEMDIHILEHRFVQLNHPQLQ